MGNYTKKVQEIVEAESEQDKAKSDKSGGGDAQKKVEKEADVLREQYNQGCEASQAIADAAKWMCESATEATGGLLSFTVNGR